MKTLLPFFVGVLLLAACAQPPTLTQSLPTAAPPQQIEATFTPVPVEPTPTEAASPTPDQPGQEAPAATPEATPTAEASPTPTVENPNPGSGDANQSDACINKAAFYKDVNVPDGTAFKQNVTFTKTWQVRNEGTCTWDNYKLVFAGGSNLNAPLANPMPRIEPGEIADVSVELRSPPQGGIYTSLWEFESTDGQRFGVNSHGKDLIWAKISVSWYADETQAAGGGASSPGNTGGTQVATGACPTQRNNEYEMQVLALINQARAEQSLPALTLQSQLSAAAFAHSQDMGCNDFIDHTGSDGSSWATRIQAQGYAYSYASENIYVGDPDFGGTPQGAFNWWMNSDVHRKNILSTKVTEIGIGYAFVANSTYKGYYTLNFARP